MRGRINTHPQRSHRFPPWTGGGVGGVTPPTPPVLGARRTIKMNDISSYLGNATQENIHLQQAAAWHANHVQFYGLGNIFGNPSDEADLAAFISKARSIYGMQYIGCIMASQNGFTDAFTYNQSGILPIEQFNDFNIENEFWFGERVTFHITSAVVGMTYRITLDGHNYSYVAIGGDTPATIKTALYALIPTSPTPPATWTKSTVSSTTLQIWADSVDFPFSYSTAGNISVGVINLTRDEWLDLAQWLKALLVPTGEQWYTSAYVQNYSGDPRWGLADAARMIQYIDVYESTNYIPSPGDPDPARSIESQLYLLSNALFANPSLKPKQSFQYILSAEAIYSHNSLHTNGMFNYETMWQTDYNAYGTPPLYSHGANMELLGTNYFVYNQLLNAPAIVF